MGVLKYKSSGAWTPIDGSVVGSHTHLAGTTLGYAEVTADQGSITNTLTALTGLTVTVTAGSGRRLMIIGSTKVYSSVASDEFIVQVQQDNVEVGYSGWDTVVAAGRPIATACPVIVTPSASTHTYKLSLIRNTGSGTLTSTAAATKPAFLLVQDIGPVGAPGEAVDSTTAPRGVMGYAQITTTSGGHTTLADISGLSVTWTAVAGRRYKTTIDGMTTNGSGSTSNELRIRDGNSVTLSYSNVKIISGNAGAEHHVHCEYISVPGAGSVTHKMSISPSGGQADVMASSIRPSWILVEDIGV
jgi:uncharacterized protein Veg